MAKLTLSIQLKKNFKKAGDMPTQEISFMFIADEHGNLMDEGKRKRFMTQFLQAINAPGCMAEYTQNWQVGTKKNAAFLTYRNNPGRLYIRISNDDAGAQKDISAGHKESLGVVGKGRDWTLVPIPVDINREAMLEILNSGGKKFHGPDVRNQEWAQPHNVSAGVMVLKDSKLLNDGFIHIQIDEHLLRRLADSQHHISGAHVQEAERSDKGNLYVSLLAQQESHAPQGAHALTVPDNAEVPKELQCSIGWEIMKDPVILDYTGKGPLGDKSSHTYERKALENWLKKKYKGPGDAYGQKTYCKDPMTGKLFKESKLKLKSNNYIKQETAKFIANPGSYQYTPESSSSSDVKMDDAPPLLQQSNAQPPTASNHNASPLTFTPKPQIETTNHEIMRIDRNLAKFLRDDAKGAEAVRFDLLDLKTQNEHDCYQLILKFHSTAALAAYLNKKHGEGHSVSSHHRNYGGDPLQIVINYMYFAKIAGEKYRGLPGHYELHEYIKLFGQAKQASTHSADQQPHSPLISTASNSYHAGGGRYDGYS